MTTPAAAAAAAAAPGPSSNNPSTTTAAQPTTTAAPPAAPTALQPQPTKKRPLEITAANTISGLTPVVRDACLKAMRLFEDRESFDRFYLFSQAWHKGISQGTALALALLYARLFKAFSHRHIQTPAPTNTANDSATTTAKTSGKPTGSPNANAPPANSSSNEPRPSLAEKTTSVAISTWSEATAAGKPLPPVKKSAPSADGAGGNYNLDDMSEVGKVYVQKNFESLSTNVELSPRVSAAMYRIVGDLASVHALLPKTTSTGSKSASATTEGAPPPPSTTNSWTDWSVAAICVAAHDFVVASLHQPKLRKAWKVALHGTNTPAQERDMFFIFCEKTTEWMAGRLVRALESYQDFVVVWSKSVLHDHIAIKSHHNDPRRYQYLDIGRLEWEPAVPSAAAHSKAQSPPKMPKNNNKDKDVTGGAVPTSALPGQAVKLAYKAESRARSTAWKLAVFYSLFVQQKQQQRIPSRRQRLIANAGAIAFILGLQRLVQHEKDFLAAGNEGAETKKSKTKPDDDKMDVDSSGDTPKAGSTEKSKDDEATTWNSQVAPGLDVLLEAANKECAFTRWACLDQLKIAQNLDVKEIYFAAFQLAKSVFTFSQSRLDEAEKTRQQTALTDKGPIDVSGLPMWLQQLHHRVGKNASSILWTLPSFSTVLVDSFSRTLRSEKIKVEAAFYFDETSLVTNERQFELLCSCLNRPMPNDRQADSRFTAVAGSDDRTGMVDQPDQVENAIAKRRKIDKNEEILKSASPAVISEAMTLTEWTVALLYLEQVKPPSKLRQFLKAAGVPKDDPKGDWSQVIVPILNSTLLRLSQEGLMGKTSRKASVSVQTLAQGGEEGVGSVVLASNVGSGDLTHDKALCRALVAFYYHALECILKHETKRLDGSKDHAKLIFDASFHRALLTCCTLCVVKAVGTTQKLRPSADVQSIKIYQALLVCDCCPYEFLKVSELFLESMASDESQEKKKGRSPFLRVLPRILKQDFQRAETNVIESLVWAHDAKFGVSFPDLLEEFADERNKDGEEAGIIWWPVKALNNALSEEDLDLPDASSSKTPTPSMVGYEDYVHVNSIVESVLRRAYHRIALICLQLDVPVGAPLAKHAWICFRHLIRTRAMLFFDRHLDHWILCCLYGVSKKIKMDPEIKFTKIVDAYISVRGPEMGDVTCQRIVRNIKIDDSSDGGSLWGDVIALYNKIFVPAMKDHLFESLAIEKAEKEAVANRYPVS